MKFAIIGLGHRGKKYLAAVSQCHEAKLVAACDMDERNAALLDKNVHFYTNIDEMLAKEQIDVAVVAVPHHLYLNIITKLAEKKVHIIKEKPFATSLLEANAMESVLQKSGVEMMIAVQRRFDKHYQIFERLLKQVGKISHIRGSYTLNIDRLDDGWRASQQHAGGGVLSDMGYHFIDLLIWYFGLPADISCSNTQNSKINQIYDVEDSSILNFEYMHSATDVSQKTIGSFFISRVSIDCGETIVVQGQYGSIKLTPDTISCYDIHNRLEYSLKKEALAQINPLTVMVEHFIHYLKKDVKTLVADYREHFHHVRMIATAYHADRLFTHNSLTTIKQKMMLMPPPAASGTKRDRDETDSSPEKQKQVHVEKVADNLPDFVWPIITEQTRAHILAQTTADNISCYNRSGIVEEFENNFSRYHDRKYAISTNSGTSAIHAIYSALQLKKYDEVLVPSNTFHATVSPLLHTGGIPIFVDCLANGNIDPEDMERKITVKTKAVMVTHLWGIPCDMDRITALCQRYNLILLEDCSHAHGARYKGKLVGTFGLAAAWSLNGPKLISGGEGGIILTDDKEMEIRCNLLGQYNNRALQITPPDHPLRRIALTGLGLKHRITTVAAAMANEQLAHLDDWLHWKRFYATLLRQQLADIPFIYLPDINDTEPAWYAFTFYLDEIKAGVSREIFLQRLHEKGLKEIKTPGSTCPQEKLELYRHPSQYLPQIFDHDPLPQAECAMSNKLYQACIKMPMWALSTDLRIVNKYISGIREVAFTLMDKYDQGEIQTMDSDHAKQSFNRF